MHDYGLIQTGTPQKLVMSSHVVRQQITTKGQSGTTHDAKMESRMFDFFESCLLQQKNCSSVSLPYGNAWILGSADAREGCYN